MSIKCHRFIAHVAFGMNIHPLELKPRAKGIEMILQQPLFGKQSGVFRARHPSRVMHLRELVAKRPFGSHQGDRHATAAPLPRGHQRLPQEPGLRHAQPGRRHRHGGGHLPSRRDHRRGHAADGDVTIRGRTAEVSLSTRDMLDILEHNVHFMVAGRMELELAPFDLPLAIDNARTFVRERATKHGIMVDLHIDERLGDDRIRQSRVVAQNLLDFAIGVENRQAVQT